MRRPAPLALFTLGLLGLAACGDDEALPEILVTPEFTLDSHQGEPFSSRDLVGHVWVASFVFTSCRDVCPLITNAVANFHRRARDPRLRFVSFSVDPEVDTPEVLSGYRERYGADERWIFLTGPRPAVRSVVAGGFHVAMGEPEGDDVGYDISHGEHLLLVDQRGVLRGQYETDRAGLDRLARDIDSLLAAD